VVAIADPVKVAGARVSAARRLAQFLREPDTQQWIAEFGKGQFDDAPLFHPVQVNRSVQVGDGAR
jgi:ABC-type tungstate transport system permease subunit